MRNSWEQAMQQSMCNAPVPFGLVNPESLNFTFTNAAFQNVLNHRHRHARISPEQSLQQLKDMALLCLQDGQTHTLSCPESHIQLTLVPVSSEEGRLLGIQCFAQERQDALFEQLDQTLNNLSVGVWLSTAEGKIYWVNRANPGFCASPDSPQRHEVEWINRLHPDDVAVCASSFSKAAIKGVVEPFEFRMQAPDGSMRWYYTDGGPLYRNDGSLICWSGIALDIQRFKDNEARLQRDIERLRAQQEAESKELKTLQAELSRVQKMDLLGQLAGNVAHDFNNLLFVIRLNTGKLMSLSQDPELTGYAEMIQQDVTRAARTATELMTFSGRQPKQPQTYAMADLLADLDILLRHAVGAEVDFQIEQDEGLGSIHIDKTYFENALLNLAVNARDAVAGRGRIRIRAQNELAAREEKSSSRAWVRLDVIDNGTGMDAATLARVCEPFFTTKPVGQGAGLGMSMVERFTRDSGGRMDIRSAPGQGTTVSLLLPHSQQTANPDTEEKPELASGEGNILLIEDDLSVRNAVARLLMDMGYEVSIAYSPDVAIEYIRQGLRPDLILSDVRMPGTRTVADMLLELEAEGLLPPVLLMSGYAFDETDSRGLIASRFPVLNKPMSDAVLTQKVREAIQSGQAKA